MRLVLRYGEVQHFFWQWCLSIGVELMQWLLCCWRMSWSKQYSGKLNSNFDRKALTPYSVLFTEDYMHDTFGLWHLSEH